MTQDIAPMTRPIRPLFRLGALMLALFSVFFVFKSFTSGWPSFGADSEREAGRNDALIGVSFCFWALVFGVPAVAGRTLFKLHSRRIWEERASHHAARTGGSSSPDS